LSKYQPPTIRPEEEKFIVRSPYPDIEIPEVSLSDYVWKDVKKWEEHVALVKLSNYLFACRWCKSI
jgi:hypothetical protein